MEPTASSGKIAVVTGGGSGIGRATALALAEHGWRVALLGRTQRNLDETVAGLPRDTAIGIACDVTDSARVDAAMREIVERWGRIDLLFNNAGSFGEASSIAELSDEQWESILAVNVTGMVYCARSAVQIMRDQEPRGGRIINNGSIASRVPRPRSVGYAVTKHAVTGLSRSIALDGRSIGVTCTQVDIGNAATELLAGIGAASGALQADGSRLVEPTFDVSHVAGLIAAVAELPLEVSVPELVVTATGMPYDGRG